MEWHSSVRRQFQSRKIAFAFLIITSVGGFAVTDAGKKGTGNGATDKIDSVDCRRSVEADGRTEGRTDEYTNTTHKLIDKLSMATVEKSKTRKTLSET